MPLDVLNKHCSDHIASSPSSSCDLAVCLKCFVHEETIKARDSVRNTGVDDCMFMSAREDR